MTRVIIKTNLHMRDGAKFGEVDLSGARIGGKLTMERSTFSGKLEMDSIHVDCSLLMNETTFGEVDLIGARVGDQLSMNNSNFSGDLIMEGITVGASCLARNVKFIANGNNKIWKISAIFANINRNLRLDGSDLNLVDLTGATVKGELSFGIVGDSSSPKWSDNSKLLMTNATVGALIDRDDASWPINLELTGFTCGRLGGGRAETAFLAQQDVNKIVSWLDRQENFTPQPFDQMAKVLEMEGLGGKARAVLYAKKERERKLSDISPVRKFFLLLEKLFIGYGYYNYYAIGWIALLAIIGWGVFHCSGEGLAHGMPYGFSYSLDMMLPIIHLRELHYKIDLDIWWVRYYFYFHQFMGYVLFSFILAGLSGLTKK